MAITSPSYHMPRSTPDPTPCHHDDPPVRHAWWAPVLHMSMATGVVATISHASIQLPFTGGAWMLHMAVGLIFAVGAIDNLSFFAIRHKP